MAVVKRKITLKKVGEPTPRELIGPGYDPERDGVTFSVLQKFINCRHLALFGLQQWTGKRIGPSMLYGTIVHALNEAVYGAVRAGTLTKAPGPQLMNTLLDSIEAKWKAENPKAAPDTVNMFQQMARLTAVVMPHYFRHWAKDFQLDWQEVEVVFSRAMTIPMTREPGSKVWTVPVRGKMDGVFNAKGPWLFETKTKSRMGEAGETVLVETMPFELQLSTYLSSLHAINQIVPSGVLYNIIRKPGIEPKKGETPAAFAQRLSADISKRPEFYFVRMRMSIDKSDVAEQERRLARVVRSFMLWYHGIDEHYPNSAHCENKYGTCNMLAMCARGDGAALYKRPVLFSELEEGGL